MAEVGDRVAVASNKMGTPPREGVVTAVSGRMITIEWSNGGQTMLTAAPGSIQVLGRSRARKKTPARKAPARKTPARKAPAARATVKAAAKKATPAKKTVKKATPAKAPAKKATPAKKTAKKAPVKKAATTARKNPARGGAKKR
jgi:hypothetical protein